MGLRVARASVLEVLSNMRHASSFRPEWACPAASFMRAIGVVLVALAVGATAGATVVFSLVDQPVGQTSAAALSLTLPIQAASTLSSETQTAQPDLRVSVPSGSANANASATDRQVESHAAATLSIRSTTPEPASSAALAEAGPATGNLEAKAGAAPSSVAEKPPVVAPADKKVTKKHHVAARYAWRGGPFGLPPGQYHVNGIWTGY